MFDWLKRCHQAAWARAFAKKPTPRGVPVDGLEITVGGVTYPYRNLGAQKFECTAWLNDGSRREFLVDAHSHVDASAKCETLLCDQAGIDRGDIKYIMAQPA